MPMKPVFLTLLSICLMSTAYSSTPSKILTSEQLKAIEEQVDRELKSEKLDDTKRLAANLLAGREFYQYRFFDKSKKYYEAAIALPVNGNKTEAYINLMAIAVTAKKKQELKVQYDLAQDYFKKNQNLNTDEVKYYLAAIESHLTGKSSSPVKGFYGPFAKESSLVELFKNKKYSDVLVAINPEALESDEQITLETIIYDSANVALNKKSVKKMYCMPEYKKYPNAYTYGVLLCGLLNDYVETSKFNAERLKRAETYFSKDNTDKAYLFEVVKEIK